MYIEHALPTAAIQCKRSKPALLPLHGTGQPLKAGDDSAAKTNTREDVAISEAISKDGSSDLKRTSSLDGLISLHSLGSLTEAILETTRHVTKVTQTTGTGGVTPLGLHRPIVLADLGTRVSARRAHLLLNVVRASAASHADRMRLARPLSIT